MDTNVSFVGNTYRVNRPSEGRRDGRSGAFEHEMQKQLGGKKRKTDGDPERPKPEAPPKPDPEHRLDLEV